MQRIPAARAAAAPGAESSSTTQPHGRRTEAPGGLQEHVRFRLAVRHLLGGDVRGQIRVESGALQHRLDRRPRRTRRHRHGDTAPVQQLHELPHLREDLGRRPGQLQIQDVLGGHQFGDGRFDPVPGAQRRQCLVDADADEREVLGPGEAGRAVLRQQTACRLVVGGLAVHQRGVEIEDDRRCGEVGRSHGIQHAKPVITSAGSSPSGPPIRPAAAAGAAPVPAAPPRYAS